ncbi:hypothetical protein R4J71_27035 [Pseudomonas aeruginosa]|nr:hypothetical protein [Pseudomonas aeruginosa]MDV7809458.1 hypothetical protein [Pseudomonas aeruginosa]
MEKLGWRDRRVSPDSGSLFQTFPKKHQEAAQEAIEEWNHYVNYELN